MIYITGDTHRNFKCIEQFCDEMNTSKNDYMIILGDAGINYYGDSNGDLKLKKRLAQLPITLFCIHGNHEMRPYVGKIAADDLEMIRCNAPGYRITKLHNGDIRGRAYVQPDFPNLLFAIDGEIYKMNTKADGAINVLTIGGAYSVDKWYRIYQGMGWFANEQPDDFTKARVKLAIRENDIDVIMSHTCPKRWIPTELFLPGIDQSKVDNSTEDFLDDVLECVGGYLGHWYFGHYHGNKEDPQHMYTMLFDEIQTL